MGARISQSTHVANVVAAAQARGVTDPLALASIRLEAIDHWQSRINTYSGVPAEGSTADQGH